MHKISKFCISEEKTSKFCTSECTSKFCTMWFNKTSKFCTCEGNTSNLSTSENASKLSTGECIKLANQNGSSVSRLSLALWGIKGQVDVTAGEWWWHNHEHVFQLAAAAVAIYNTKLLFCSFQVTRCKCKRGL